MITINIVKALQIHQQNLREARDPILKKLDVDFQRALEEGKDTSSIVAAKKELRDITTHPNLLNAKSADEIKKFWPKILGPRP